MRPPVWLLAIAAVILVTAAVRVLGDTPPTTVDGLRVMSVSEVLAARAAGGLKGQPVAVGGYWSNGYAAHMCAVPLGPPGALELYCVDGEFGITQNNEPIQLVGRFNDIVYTAKGPHLTPFFDNGEPGTSSHWQPDGSGWGDPPVPIVLIGHFDDPRAEECHAESRQICLDRLVVNRIAYFNRNTTAWPEGLPAPDPTDPPAPPHY